MKVPLKEISEGNTPEHRDQRIDSDHGFATALEDFTSNHDSFRIAKKPPNFTINHTASNFSKSENEYRRDRSYGRGEKKASIFGPSISMANSYSNP